MSKLTVRETFRIFQTQALRDPSTLANLNALVAFQVGATLYLLDCRFAGAGRRSWFVKTRYKSPVKSRPDVTFVVERTVWLQIVDGSLDTEVARRDRQIRVEGGHKSNPFDCFRTIVSYMRKECAAE